MHYLLLLPWFSRTGQGLAQGPLSATTGLIKELVQGPALVLLYPVLHTPALADLGQVLSHCGITL